MNEILKEELVLAAGCTEPLAIAYAASIVRDYLEGEIKKLNIVCSPNIVKNVNSVKIPNTNGRRGIKAAAVAGYVAGNSKLKLEAIKNVEKEKIDEILKELDKDYVNVILDKEKPKLYIKVQGLSENDKVTVEIMHTHTNVTKIKKNHEIVFQNKNDNTSLDTVLADRSILNVKDIYDFALNGNIDEVRDLIEKQIECNYNIAKEGMENDWGSNVGQTLLGDDLYLNLIAYASAGSDARMSGCNMPVMTNSGSGNQGMTLSVPIIHYAKEKNINHEELVRALVFANLINVYLKTGIGRLSAYCGAVCAGKSAWAGIAFINKDSLDIISDLITNGIATDSGIICDGAKESCASKIATSLFSGYLGYKMAKKNRTFPDECGIVKENVDKTIESVWEVASTGMKKTDEIILDVMLEKK
jgi:L-cysteine desulfidase